MCIYMYMYMYIYIYIYVYYVYVYIYIYIYIYIFDHAGGSGALPRSASCFCDTPNLPTNCFWLSPGACNLFVISALAYAKKLGSQNLPTKIIPTNIMLDSNFLGSYLWT